MIQVTYKAMFFDEAGNCIEVQPDLEGLGILQINHTGFDSENKRFLLSKDEGYALAEAITKVIELNKEIE